MGRKTHSSAALSSTNPKQTGLALKPGLCAAMCTYHLLENVGNIVFGHVYEFCSKQIAAESLCILTLQFLKWCQMMNFMLCAPLLVL